jgi:Pyruvate/2-oxoacid:ferredoxin oxidoreductase gamma subunit
VPLSDIAREVQAAGAASLVAIGALAAVTRLVSAESLIAGMHESLPPYRRARAEGNARAIAAGAGSVRAQMDAWSAVREGVS